MRPTLVDILETYFSKEELKTFLEEAGLKKSGTKRELAERLVNESNYDPAFLLSRLTKEDLLWILEEEFGLSFPRSTKKQELIDAILNEVEEIPEGYDRRQSYEMTHTRGNRNLEKAILKSLKIFKPYRFEKESELEGQLVVHLRNTIEGAEITPQKAGAKRGDAFVPDIVIENYRPGTMEKLGVGYETLKEVNPGIVYGCVSGFGHYGPYKDRAGYDIIGQAMGGLMSTTGWPDGEPTRTGTAMGDVLAGLSVTIGLLAAIRYRDKTGIGQKVDVSLVDSVVASLEIINQIYLIEGEIPQRIGNRYESVYPYDSFKAKDGSLVIGCGNDKLWSKLCNLMG
ncbi:MAG: hypothetical protein PWP39_1790, partial [Pyrococcus sp.]|uniref:CoA transferase n=1 Tax=Pyrococcus sp. TaxID=33866 RepID=UPI00258DFB80